MGGREPVSVLLPTVEWNDVCDQLVAQIRSGDELLVICDTQDDPLAECEPPDGVEVLVAGEPEGCSGKANAIACGMEHATNDRFVWTDADFSHDDGWLNRLVTAGQEKGPATSVCVFVGDRWFRPFEAWSTVFFSLTMYFNVGIWGNRAWAGGVTFTRDELRGSVADLTAELTQVVSDDGLLSDHLEKVHPVRSMVETVEVEGDLRSVSERVSRFIRIVHVRDGAVTHFLSSLVLIVAAVLFPVPTAVVYTAITGIAYAILGVRRWTPLAAYPAVLAVPVVTLSGIMRKEFEWTGRRYRLNDKFDVDVIER